MHVCHHVSSWFCRAWFLAAGLRLTDPLWLHDRRFSSGLLGHNSLGRGLRCHRASHGLPLAAWLRSPGGRARRGSARGFRLGCPPPLRGPRTPPAGCVGRFRPAAWPRALARAAYGSSGFLSGWCPAVSWERVAAARAVVDWLRFAPQRRVCARLGERGEARLGSGAGVRRGRGRDVGRGRGAPLVCLLPGHAAAGLRLTGALGVRVTAL